MVNNFTYFRKYIIFKSDYLSIPGINPKGHGKIEIKGTKGNISVNIENCEIEKDYTISFLKDSNGQVMEYNLGRIITDDKGRGKVDIPINLKDLESQGFSIEKINAILIRKDNYILLGGYIHKDGETIDRFIKNLNPKEEFEETTIETVEYDTIEENVIEENVIEEINIIEENIIEEDPQAINNQFIELDTRLEDLDTSIVEPDLGPMDLNQGVVYNSYEENSIENYEILEYTRRLNHKNQMIGYILNILRFFPQVEPFKLNIQGYSFWQIDDNGVDSYQGFLPYFNYLMSADYKYPFLGNSTTCINQIKEHGHYLFGLYTENEDTKYYIYGVPGKFTIEEHPFRGITGFNTWYEAIDSMGYWLLYIDPMTGEIIHPLNPMVPIY